MEQNKRERERERERERQTERERDRDYGDRISKEAIQIRCNTYSSYCYLGEGNLIYVSLGWGSHIVNTHTLYTG